MNEWLGGRKAHTAPIPYLVNSSNLLKATMAPIRWHSGEKPLSMKSSVLCLSRSGLETLMGMAILQGEEKGKLRQLLPTWPSLGALPTKDALESQVAIRGFPRWGLKWGYKDRRAVAGQVLRGCIRPLRTWNRRRAQEVSEGMNDEHIDKFSPNVVPR